jgi:hypothetical protein
VDLKIGGKKGAQAGHRAHGYMAGWIDEKTGKLYILINIRRARLRHWNKEVKTEKPEQLFPSHLLFNVTSQEQGT